MAVMDLVLTTPENGLITKVISAWDKQVSSLRAPQGSMVQSLRTYEAALQPDKTYGVYIFCSPDASSAGRPPYDALVHINHAFPKSPKPILRLVWLKIAPKYEWSDNLPVEHARIFSGILGAALRLSEGALKSPEIKLYLVNHTDRAYGKLLAAHLTSLPALPFHTRVKGSWLHLTWK